MPPPPAQPAAHLQPSPQLSPHGPSDLCKALEAVELAQKYIEQQIGLHGDGDSGFVTSSHVHLLRDLKARLKARSEMV